MHPAALHHPAIDAALSCAASLTGMEVVFIAGIDETTFTVERMRGAWGDVTEGFQVDRVDTFCHRLLGGAPPTTHDAARDVHYRDAPIREQLGIRSYAGVVIRDKTGRAVGTLCGIDHRAVPVGTESVAVLQELAGIIAAQISAEPVAEGLVIRRTPSGWAVGDDGTDDLTSALVLADLLAEDVDPGRRPDKPATELDEIDRLRVAVSQLEHALAARVTVEQAIGVLAERRGVGPRESFESLRRVARSNGQRVHDLAKQVVASVTDPNVELETDLHR